MTPAILEKPSLPRPPPPDSVTGGALEILTFVGDGVSFGLPGGELTLCEPEVITVVLRYDLSFPPKASLSVHVQLPTHPVTEEVIKSFPNSTGLANVEMRPIEGGRFAPGLWWFSLIAYLSVTEPLTGYWPFSLEIGTCSDAE